MKRLILALLSMLFARICFAQTDTIFTYKEQIPCSVKLITPEFVNYSYPGEDLVISIYKNTIYKIVFSNGREQLYSEPTSINNVMGLLDYNKVSLTRIESEVENLYKLGEVVAVSTKSSNANQNKKIEDLAFPKMKQIAAMMGANVIHLVETQQGFYGNVSYLATIKGIAYASSTPNIETFKTLLEGKTQHFLVLETKLTRNAKKVKTSEHFSAFTIDSIKNENGLIILKGSIQDKPKNQTFRVISFDKDYFYVYYSKNRRAYNFKIKI